MGGRSTGREGRDWVELFLRDPKGSAATGFRPAVNALRPSVRSAGGWTWRQDDQHASTLGGGSARLLRFPAVQSRRVRQRRRGDARGRIADARALSRRLDDAGTGAALRAGVLPRGLLAGGSGATISADERRLGCAAGESRGATQRYAPGDCGPRAAADPARRCASRVGSGVGYHATNTGVHQPHAAARGAREVAARVVRDAAASPSRTHLRDQSPLAGLRAATLS